jgi:hypothetical protein
MDIDGSNSPKNKTKKIGAKDSPLLSKKKSSMNGNEGMFSEE